MSATRRRNPTREARPAPPASRGEVDTLNAEAWDLMLVDPAAALELAETARGKAEELAYDAGLASAWLNVGWCRSYLGDPRGGLEAAELADAIFSRSGGPEDRAKSLNLLGALYYDTGRFDRALDYFSHSLDAARKAGLPGREATTLNNIGEVCLALGNAKEALDYFLRAYELLPEGEEGELIANVLMNVGAAFVRLENFPLAREFALKALDISERCKELLLAASCETILGKAERAEGEREMAERRFRRALDLSEGARARKQTVAALFELGALLGEEEARSAEALACLERGAAIADEIGAVALLHRGYALLAEAEERSGDFEAALSHYRRFSRYERQILDEDTTRKIKSVQIRYEVERSQREAEIFRLRNTELKEKTEQLERANREIVTIAEIGRRITASLELHKVVGILHESLAPLLSTEVLGIAVRESEEDCLEYAYYFDEGKERGGWRIPLESKSSLAAWAFLNRKPVVIDDVIQDWRKYLELKPTNQGKRKRSVVIMPLAVEDRMIGVLTVQAGDPGSYSEGQVRLLEALAPFVAIAVENSLIHDRLEELNRVVTSEKLALERASDQITHLANHDSLTGLPNRRLLFELLRQGFDAARRDARKVAVIFVDLDDFKPINDRYGHIQGDRALVEVSERLRRALRASDTVARVGGDEFVAVINGPRTRSDILRVASKIVDECCKPFGFLPQPGGVSVSMGAAIFPDDGDTIEEILNRADAAMYRVKHSTKNGLEFHGETLPA
ncbi:MAG: diguanylate cyclase [Spirochaetales bacterium]|nr:diguanylate cyclase [Spirochaetales bacterium]